MGKENKIKIDMKEVIALHSVIQTVINDTNITNDELLNMLTHAKTMLYKIITEKIERSIAKEYFTYEFGKYQEHRNIADTMHDEQIKEYSAIMQAIKKYNISKVEENTDE